MSRPRTMGDPVQFRLPLAYDAALQRRASAAEQRPSHYVRRLILAALEKEVHGRVQGTPVRPEETPVPVRSTAPSCPHRQRQLLAGGLARCRDCGALRGMDQVWRDDRAEG